IELNFADIKVLHQKTVIAKMTTFIQNPLLKSIAAFFVVSIITFYEWKEVCKSEITTSFRDSVSNAMDKIGMTIISIEKTKEEIRIIHSLSVAPMLISAGMFMSSKNNIIIRF
ncbi:hypothetical protein PQX56_004921, partial [Salmonella enterica]|nr:hypothetical protein [Salmonella enterica]